MKDLVKNPIGIIALFISLIYGFANLLLGTTASSLTPDERYPIIIFIVLFPVVVLGVYYLLVSRHHGKLYAPGDYQDDKSFLRTLSQEERELKLDKEAKEALPEPLPHTGSPQTPDQGTQPPDPQRVADLRNELRLVESLAVTKFETEFGQRADRDVAIGDTGVSFDAAFNLAGKFTFLEIKNLRYPSAVSMVLDRILYNAMVVDRYMNGNFKLVVAVVYSFEKTELPRVESVWRKRLDKCPVAVELRFIARGELGA